MTLGERIKANRQRQGISQAKLGELLLVSQQAVAKWEKSIAEPDSTALKTMASLFHTTTDELLGFTEITPELKVAGVGRRAIYLSDDEFDWLELRSEVLRTKGEEYLKTLKVMIEAVTKS